MADHLITMIDRPPPPEQWRREAIHWATVILRDAYDQGTAKDIHDAARELCIVARRGYLEEQPDDHL